MKFGSRRRLCRRTVLAIFASCEAQREQAQNAGADRKDLVLLDMKLQK